MSGCNGHVPLPTIDVREADVVYTGEHRFGKREE
jgi:hypothetical protein